MQIVTGTSGREARDLVFFGNPKLSIEEDKILLKVQGHLKKIAIREKKRIYQVGNF